MIVEDLRASPQAAGGEAGSDDAARTEAAIATLLKGLGIGKRRRLPGKGNGGPVSLGEAFPEVHAGDAAGRLRKICRTHRLPAARTGEILDRLAAQGMVFVPEIDAVFVREFRAAAAGEAAAHFIRDARQDRLHRPAPAVSGREGFYRRVLDEAIGFLGSAVLEPDRPYFFETDLLHRHAHRAADRAPADRPLLTEYREVLDALLLHKRLEREAPEALEARVEAILAERPGQGPLLAQQLGSLLGQQLRDAGRAGRVAPRLLRHLFQGSGPAAGAPAAVYAHLARESAPPEPALEVAEP